MTNEAILRISNLKKSFGALLVINEVSFEVRRGAIHAVIGPNGAGKTTLFNLLTGFLKPSGGEIFFRGQAITGLPPHRIARRGLARSFQITSIFPDLSVHENVRVSAQASAAAPYNFLADHRRLGRAREKADHILEIIGLADKRDVVSKHLAYGEKRILDIGISLATDPELVLLDEPLAGAQTAEQERIMGLIEDVARSLTVVMIDHNIDVVTAISHHITVLSQGSIIAHGTPAEIRQNAKVQEAYLGGD
ncbi:MAG: ABC transporter ATP-binding protein [Pseudomonadota bacterium]